MVGSSISVRHQKINLKDIQKDFSRRYTISIFILLIIYQIKYTTVLHYYISEN